jgi:hypothetical protein
MLGVTFSTRLTGGHADQMMEQLVEVFHLD